MSKVFVFQRVPPPKKTSEQSVDPCIYVCVSASLPETISQNEIPETIPQSELPETIPQSELPETILQSELPETIPQSELPETIPQSELPETIPQNEEFQEFIGTFFFSTRVCKFIFVQCKIQF